MMIKLAHPLPPRKIQPRLWRQLALASATVSLAAMPALGDARPRALETARQMGATLWLADGGEAGEAGVAATGDDTVDLLNGLMQIEGHLASGLALWASGDHNNGQAHMGHPHAEVYDGLAPTLQQMGVPPFISALDGLLDAAASGADQASLDALYAEIHAQISAIRQTAVTHDPRDDFTAIVAVIAKAGVEWSNAVSDGQIHDLHEYQDAWGFVQAVEARLSDLAQSPDAAIQSAAQLALAALAELAPALPGVTPGATIQGDPSLFAAAAAKIELAAFKVK
jgi:hypothetical protein